MRFQSITQRIVVLPAIVAAIGLTLAACSSSSSPGKPKASPSASATNSASSGAGTGSPSAASEITKNWEAFFSASTPVSQRVALLQDGSVFSALITAQSKNSLASSASAKVNKVTDVTSAQANVDYSIDVAGATALANQKGVAVDQGGTWKVGTASFCGLLQLEKTSGLIKLPSIPSACPSAG